MEQPPRYVAQKENTDCKLNKAIYILKHHSRVRFEKFSTVIVSIEFQYYHYDHPVLIRHTTSGIVFLLYM